METGRTWPVLCLELRPGSPERNYVLGNFLGNNCRHELPKQACGRLASLIKGLLKSLIAIHGDKGRPISRPSDSATLASLQVHLTC